MFYHDRSGSESEDEAEKSPGGQSKSGTDSSSEDDNVGADADYRPLNGSSDSDSAEEESDTEYSEDEEEDRVPGLVDCSDDEDQGNDKSISHAARNVLSSAAECSSSGSDGEYDSADDSIVFSSDDDSDRDSLLLSDDDFGEFRKFKLNNTGISPATIYGRKRARYTMDKKNMPRSLRHDLDRMCFYFTDKLAMARYPKPVITRESYLKLEERLRGLLGYLDELTQGECFHKHAKPKLEQVLWERRKGLLGYMHYLNDRRLLKVRNK